MDYQTPELPPRRPRIVLTRARTLAIVTMSYVGVIGNTDVLLRYVEYVRGEGEDEAAKWSLVCACIMGVFWVGSVFLILRDWRRHSREKQT